MNHQIIFNAFSPKIAQYRMAIIGSILMLDSDTAYRLTKDYIHLFNIINPHFWEE